MTTDKPSSTTTQSEALWTSEQVAGFLKVSVVTVRRWAASGKIPAPLTIGGAHRWREAVLVQWVRDGCPRVDERQEDRSGDDGRVDTTADESAE